ncbi:MAG: hypothetical protein HWE30_11635 [Methylocystaceae bacterium]|nr:hypothetical protein [Methylocystaceae bacterium]
MKNDMSQQPGFKRLRKLMDDPRYWRDQDPSYVEMIRQGFRDLYDSPSQAGEAANVAGVNGPIHGQDTEVGHLTKGEIVIPHSAQTPRVLRMLREVLGGRFDQYVVGSSNAQRNPTSGLPAYADNSYVENLKSQIEQGLANWASKNTSDQAVTKSKIIELQQYDMPKAMVYLGRIGNTQENSTAEWTTQSDETLKAKIKKADKAGDIINHGGYGAGLLAGKYSPAMGAAIATGTYLSSNFNNWQQDEYEDVLKRRGRMK